MRMPVGHANVNHQIDSLVRVGNELCLGTTIYWESGYDMSVRATRSYAFEVNKTDIEGVEKITRYTFDERDPVHPDLPLPDINDNFDDDTVLLRTKSQYSAIFDGSKKTDFTPDDFPELDVNDVRLLMRFESGGQILSLTLRTRSKELVVWAVSVLKEMDIVLYAQPNYKYKMMDKVLYAQPNYKNKLH